MSLLEHYALVFTYHLTSENTVNVKKLYKIYVFIFCYILGRDTMFWKTFKIYIFVISSRKQAEVSKLAFSLNEA